MKAEDHVAGLMRSLGIEPSGDLAETPSRVARAFAEMTAGYRMNPAEILSKTFDVACDELVLLRDIRFTSICEHHLLPFVGVAHVGYIPGVRVVGLSKLARLVSCFAMRAQVQERLTRQIADALVEHLSPRGVGVVVEAKHSCMGHRGAKQPDATMTTSAMLGLLRESGEARSEFLRLVGRA